MRPPLALLLLLAMLASTVAPSELPSSPADPVVSLRAAVERGRTPPAAVAERPGSPLAGKRAVEESGNVTATDLDLLVDPTATPPVWLPLTLFQPPCSSSPPPPHPALLMMHATGVDRSHMRSRALAAARRGYVVVTPDARAHGGFLEGAAHPRTAYTDALVAAFRARGAAHPFLLDTVWDLQRVLDWLARRPDVDPGRVGATGVSLGGMQAWLLAAADARVAAAAPLIGVQSFRYAADNDAWQARAASIQPVFDAAAADEGKAKPDAATFRHVLDVLTPGLLTDYDAPQSVPTIAPRPFLAVNGELDPRCPLAGVRAAMDRAAAAYERAGARDAVQLVVVPGVGHEVVPSMDDAVAAWLDRWLLRKGGGGTR